MIREVCLSDVPAVCRINNHYVLNTTISFDDVGLSYSQMTDRILDITDRYPFFVYETDGEVVGYCYAHQWKDRVAYRYTLETTIYIDPEHRGRGMGKRLMRRLIDACREQHVKVLIACITSDNNSSIDFHRSLGFVQVSLFKNVGYKFGNWLDVVDMELEL